VGFLQAGGGCGGGPRLAPIPAPAPNVGVLLALFFFQVGWVGSLTLLEFEDEDVGSGLGTGMGPRRPLPVAFSVGIPPETKQINEIRPCLDYVKTRAHFHLPAKSPAS